MEGWELWRWKNYGGVGTLEMEKIWRCGNFGDGKIIGDVRVLEMEKLWRCGNSSDGKIMEV
jgi:hypothetical protein